MSYTAASVQIGVIARLRGDVILQGMLGSAPPGWNIFDADGIPVNQPFPYIVTFPILNQKGEAFAFGTDAMDTFQQVSTFTKSQGFAQARSIAGRIYALFDQKALDRSSDGFNQYKLLFDQDQEIGDGIVQHIPMRFKICTQG